MVVLSSARIRFAAAVMLFVAWVGVLTTMAVTSSTRPPSQPVNDGPAQETTPSPSTVPR